MENDDDLSGLEPINEVFETLLNQSRDDGIEASVVNDAESEYNNRELVSNEISDMADNISFNSSVDKNTRMGLERYALESLPGLPALNSYTTGPSSSINFHETLEWVKARAEVSKQDAIQHGARYIAIALQWLLTNAFAQQDDMLNARAIRSINAEKDIKIQEARVSGDCHDLNALRNFAESVDYPIEDDGDLSHLLNSQLLRPHRGVLNQLTTHYCSESLNGLVDAVVFTPSETESFVEFFNHTRILFDMVLDWIKNFGDEDVKLITDQHSPIVFNEYRETLKHFTQLQLKQGGNRELDDELLSVVARRAKDLEVLMDDDDSSVRRQWIKDLRQSVYEDFNLENMEINQKITLLNPVTQLQALNHNNEILHLLIEAVRLLSKTYLDLTHLVDKRLYLQDSYSVYLSQLSE